MGDTPLRTSVAAELGSAADALRAVAADRLPAIPVGTVIADQFEVEALLGRGGMGAVYRAKDRALGRRVAIKVGLHGRDVSRIQREASALARLAHPNVVTIFEIGSHDDAPFVAMELCGGGTTRQWVEAPRAWREMVDAFIAVGGGLAAAHAAGIVHGDIKPDNILLGEDGRPRLADFGLAREVSAPDETGSGTPRYMAPELAHGSATVASDQFAFARSLTEVLAAARGVPRRILAVLARGMRADPAERWPDMATLIAHLESPRRRWLVPVLAAGALAIAGGGVVIATRTPAEAVAERQSLQPSRCEGLPVDLDWTPARTAEIRAAHPRGKGATQMFADELDHLASEWAAARRHLCKELPTLPSWSLAIGDAGRTCLLASRDEIRHLEALRDLAPADLVANMISASPPASCADPTRLEPAMLAAPIAAVATERDAIAHLHDRGDNVAALARARALVAGLPRDAPPLATGMANAILGEILLAQVGLDESAGPTRTAFFAYRVAGSPQAFEPALRLVEAYTQTDQLALADEWLAHAQAEAARVEVSAMNRAAFELSASRLRSMHGDLAGAAEAAQKALRALEASTDPRRTIVILTIRSSLSIYLAELGKTAESVAVAREVVAGREALYGPEHAELITDLFNVGLGELDLGHPEPALAALSRARAIADARLPEGAVLRGYALWNEALALGRTDRRAARSLFDRALAILITVQGDASPDVVQLRADRTRWSNPS